MTQPSEKDPNLDALIKGVFNVDRVSSIRENKCGPRFAPDCDGTANKFKDALSAKEYTISGMCQKCQDHFYQ